MSGSKSLILASASPRRGELLAYLGVPFIVRPADVDEAVPEHVADSAELASEFAAAKARKVAAGCPLATVLGADTIVVLEGRILGKPGDEIEARAMLRDLRGRSHQVITALALVNSSGAWLDHCETEVHMRDYIDKEIDEYIASGEPFDKAGSYAIQDQNFNPVSRFTGCYCNVVGLPLLPVIALLEQAGFRLLDTSPSALPSECLTCPQSSKVTFHPACGPLECS